MRRSLLVAGALLLLACLFGVACGKGCGKEEDAPQRVPADFSVSTQDTTCNPDTLIACDDLRDACDTTSFVAPATGLYVLEARFIRNEGAVEDTCRACAAIFDGRTALQYLLTDCNGALRDSRSTMVQLEQGKRYTLQSCLVSCSWDFGCDCGEQPRAEGEVRAPQQ